MIWEEHGKAKKTRQAAIRILETLGKLDSDILTDFNLMIGDAEGPAVDEIRALLSIVTEIHVKK